MADTPRPQVRPRVGRAQFVRPTLYEGDLVEFSMTVEVTNSRNQKFWIKGGGTTQIRPGEPAQEARERLENFVQEGIDQQVKAVLHV